ncbi:MAG: 4Fe-4S dicluster domain-containing protein [Peptococcaceae bacterium]|jgi:ferredoxin|nr:4Fe-4S dicluster domain-containing protein [Peptococcaceae bacterium]MDH7525163.1 4Fe-4S dicluster domain-containing protein [Peptococcaceae bacterium]
MKEITQKMRDTARELLSSGQVALVLGWEKGYPWYKSAPTFIDKVEDVERLVFDEFCHNNLSKYLLDLAAVDGKVALFVKGCDSRGVNRLIQDNQVKREQLYIIGIPCPGLKDPDDAAGKNWGDEINGAVKCQDCRFPNPVVYDLLLGEKVPAVERGRETRELIERLEKMKPDERYEFWAGQFNRCIRCYACRNICPACNCRECVFDRAVPEWLGKANNLVENQFMQLTRAIHVAGRCIECGECERACPVNIPLMALNRKIINDIEELFGEEPAGLDPEKKTPLGRFELDDPEKFM